MIGLTEDAATVRARGYTPTRSAIGYERFRRFGMPFQITPKARLSATSPACRAVVATRLAAPELEKPRCEPSSSPSSPRPGRWKIPRRCALPSPESRAWTQTRSWEPSTTAMSGGIRGRSRSRATAAGSPTEFQGRAANTDGAVRYTAPSLVFVAQRAGPGGRRLPADRGLRRRDREPRPDAGAPSAGRRPVEVLDAFPYPPDDRRGRRRDVRAPGVPNRPGRRGRAHRGDRRGPRRPATGGRRVALGAGLRPGRAP